MKNRQFFTQFPAPGNKGWEDIKYQAEIQNARSKRLEENLNIRGVELIWSQANAWWPYPNIDLLLNSRIILQTYVHQYVLTIWLAWYFHSTSSYTNIHLSVTHRIPSSITWTPTALWLWIPCCIKASSLVERTTPQPIPSGSWTISLLHLDPRHDCLGQITCGARTIHVTCAGFNGWGAKTLPEPQHFSRPGGPLFLFKALLFTKRWKRWHNSNCKQLLESCSM